jgi:signal peptidase I
LALRLRLERLLGELILRIFGFEIVQVQGNSMLPAFAAGERVLIKYRTSDLQPIHVGEVVMIEREGELMLKRISRYEIGGHTGVGMVSVEGDNKAESIDSRHWGAVPSRFVKAKVIRKLKTKN